MDKYPRGRLLGKGGYGRVYESVHPVTGAPLAVKKITKTDIQMGVDLSAIREVKTLKHLGSHPNVVALHDVMFERTHICMVFEMCPCDLERIIHDKAVPLSPAHIKAYMQMMLRALAHLHVNDVLHRDIKPANLLVGMDGQLKLTDFGLAGFNATPDRFMSSMMVTIWYRAPELLMGARQYGPAVDMWAAGCVFAELLRRSALFQGDSEIDMLVKIADVLGAASEHNWKGVEKLPGYMSLTQQRPPTGLAAALPVGTSGDALSLLTRLLCLDPNGRPSALEALSHPYFSSHPPPLPADRLPTSAARRTGDAASGAAAADDDSDDDSSSFGSDSDSDNWASDTGPGAVFVAHSVPVESEQ